MAGRHEQRIDDLERNLEEKEVYINNMECALATLTSRMDAMEDKVCRCNEVQVEEEVMEEDNPTSELSYKSQYFTPVAIAGLIKDVPYQLVPVSDLEVTPGGFKEEVRDGDVEPDSVASQVAEQVLQEEEDISKHRSYLFTYLRFFCAYFPWITYPRFLLIFNLSTLFTYS